MQNFEDQFKKLEWLKLSVPFELTLLLIFAAVKPYHMLQIESFFRFEDSGLSCPSQLGARRWKPYPRALSNTVCQGMLIREVEASGRLVHRRTDGYK